jgi:hypothetical protein
MACVKTTMLSNILEVTERGRKKRVHRVIVAVSFEYYNFTVNLGRPFLKYIFITLKMVERGFCNLLALGFPCMTVWSIAISTTKLSAPHGHNTFEPDHKQIDGIKDTE